MNVEEDYEQQISLCLENVNIMIFRSKHCLLSSTVYPNLL